MLLAEFEVWHSRPITPTRRVSRGHLALPVDPLPGFGGVLLGGVAARFVPEIDQDLVPDLHRLVAEVDRGERIVQPRLRFRFQVDQHGLGRSVHRLVGQGEDIAFEFTDAGTPLAQVLATAYCAERLGPQTRHTVCALLHRALRWSGPVGPSLISHLAGVTGTRASSFVAFADPVAWALDQLGFPPGTVKPPKREVAKQFRVRLKAVHPDHGGDERSASKTIADLGEARRILA
jgi:hypothetical protein